MTRHPAWCGRGHHCGMGEHRAAPIALTGELGRVLLTRVRTADGRQHAEITVTVPLGDTETVARKQLWSLMRDLRILLDRTKQRYARTAA
jgi:hypothetical protein